MADKFRNRYRIPSARLQGYDYSANGYYFITICTKDRENYLGKIIGNAMYLSDMGRIVQKFFQEIPQHFPFIKLDAYQIMPNHLHGILIVDKPVETPKLGVSTNKNTIGLIINQFKRICTTETRKRDNIFAWQPRFYDHIIRNETSLNRIREYIRNNPTNWDKDRNNVG